MITAEQLETKISQLTAKASQLRKQSDIDPLTATPEQIIKNAQEEQQARESAEQLELVIQKLRSQLIECREQEKQAQIREHCAAGFQALVEQSDLVEQAIATLETELKKLREMGRAIASANMATTGRLALDDRISQNYRLPTVERLNNSVIIHTESRKTVKRIVAQ